MARVILVRHCESESNRGAGLDREKNSPLSARGRAQAEAVRAAFAALGLTETVLISSPLARAADTAAAIGEALSIAVEHDARLGAGETWAGQRFDLDDPATLLIVGATVADALAERIDAGAETLIAVSHRYPIWALLVRLYGDRGSDIMDEVLDLANGDRLELTIVAGAALGEPLHRPLEG
ncbi:MAG TPA: histidine phosphatase family protein [Caulobacteraceae bacterium]|nr:histidine phosphatase family protein [Caulobacteraceae bacterium]